MYIKHFELIIGQQVIDMMVKIRGFNMFKFFSEHNDLLLKLLFVSNVGIS